MPRQLTLTFGADKQPGADAEAPATPANNNGQKAEPDADSVAESLRPRVFELLRNAQREVGIRQLRSELGFPGEYLDQDPQANPVNRILKQMRDAGEIVCREAEWDEPVFSLEEYAPPAVLDAVEIKGNELAKRQLLVAAAGDHSVALHGPDAEVARFEQLLDSFGVSRSEEYEILITMVEPAARERESTLPGTSSADINRAISAMPPLDQSRDIDPMAQTLIERFTDQWHARQMARELVLGVANTIAALDRSDTIQPHHAAEAINYAPRPSEHEQMTAPPLVRPDQQQTFDGEPVEDWPKPKHDDETITVDRPHDDIDGPAHRFVIRCEDCVEVLISQSTACVGTVLEIDHIRQRVLVAFPDHSSKEEDWFGVERVFPAAEEPTRRSFKLLPVHQETTALQPPAERTAPDQVSQEPYSLEAFREYRKRYEVGESSLDEHRHEFARVQATRDVFIANLKGRYDAKRLKGLASQFGCFSAKQNNKQQNAEHIHRVILQSFTLGASVQFNPMSETLEQAVARGIESITEDEWQRHLTERAEQQRTEQKALTNPETFAEFRIFVRERGVEVLSEPQRVRFDELLADESRASRQAKRSAETVKQIESKGAADLQMTIKEGWHDKKQCKLWIVQLRDRVDRETYNELNRKAKMLGGWYSSFKKSDAGFQFTSQEHAQRFAGLLDQDANRSDVLAGRKTRKMESAAERLVSVAESLQSQAEEVLSGDETRLKNTVRRAEMAAGARGQAYAQQAMAGTLRSIAAGLETGGAKYLDGVRAATHVSTMVSLLRRGKTKRNQALLAEKGSLGTWERHHEYESLSNRPLAVEDAGFVEFPYPAVNRHQLADLVKKAKGKKGLKQRSQRMQPHLITDREQHFVQFVDQADIEFLTDYLARCQAAGLETRWIDCGIEDYKRLRAANIHTPQELRCALRELVPHLRRKREDDPVLKAEQQLIGRQIPGFFPTPKPIISRMLELAEIEPGNRVLEPSAGKGDILDMIRENHPDVEMTAIEINATLHEVLAAKDHSVQQADFLEHRGQYDRIVMNPPFEIGQEIAHVRHAFEQLAPGGRLVSVMSAGPLFRTDRKASEFREWLETVEAAAEDLPENAFNGIEAFRQTGVRTRLVSILLPAIT